MEKKRPKKKTKTKPAAEKHPHSAAPPEPLSTGESSMADPVAPAAKIEDLEAQVKTNKDAEAAALTELENVGAAITAAKGKPAELKALAAKAAKIHAGICAECEGVQGAIDALKGALVKASAK
jgi:hypothetical protein